MFLKSIYVLACSSSLYFLFAELSAIVGEHHGHLDYLIFPDFYFNE